MWPVGLSNSRLVKMQREFDRKSRNPTVAFAMCISLALDATPYSYFVERGGGGGKAARVTTPCHSSLFSNVGI